VVVHDAKRTRLPHGARWGTFAEAGAQEVVVLAVPIRALRHVLKSLPPLLPRHALVLDVCAAKVEPARWMKELLPKSVNILGTHPFFGPDTVSASLAGRTIVLCPVRLPAGLRRRVASLLRKEGLVVRVMTPAAHDRLVARTILLTQYVGRLIRHSGIPAEQKLTEPYASLLTLTGIAERDDQAVFTDMWQYNGFSKEIGKSLRKGIDAVDRMLAEKSRGRKRGLTK
jgi:prephenate dehydrogenase